MTAAVKARIEAFEMWCYRRMMRIKFIDQIGSPKKSRRDEKPHENLDKKTEQPYRPHLET